VQIALKHRHLTGGNFDLPVVGPIFEEYVRSFGLHDRLKFHPGDFFKDPFPKADVIIMGHILHDWNLDEKKALFAARWSLKLRVHLLLRPIFDPPFRNILMAGDESR
jgi:hypothetical protein